MQKVHSGLAVDTGVHRRQYLHHEQWWCSWAWQLTQLVLPRQPNAQDILCWWKPHCEIGAAVLRDRKDLSDSRLFWAAATVDFGVQDDFSRSWDSWLWFMMQLVTFIRQPVSLRRYSYCLKNKMCPPCQRRYLPCVLLRKYLSANLLLPDVLHQTKANWKQA